MAYVLVAMLQETEGLQSMKLLTVDLGKVRGRGEFKCPECGIEISPDDETEEVYTVLEPVMKGDRLEEVVLQCNKCKSQIHVVGFNEPNTIR